MLTLFFCSGYWFRVSWIGQLPDLEALRHVSFGCVCLCRREPVRCKLGVMMQGPLDLHPQFGEVFPPSFVGLT